MFVEICGLSHRITNGQEYIWIEFYEEYPYNLAKFLEKQYKKFTTKDKLNIAWKIARSLRILHENRFSHGDLEPSNILIDKELNPIISNYNKVVDFSQKFKGEPNKIGD